MKNKIWLNCILLILISFNGFSQKKVYLILGSDTAIWDGMDVARFICHYNFNVIPDVTRNYYKAMQPAYRNTFQDSFGGKVKFTWWCMGGNIFRYADNRNVPFPNTMVPWQARKYYGEQFAQFGDELSMHYHSFVWSDYNRDGKYFWNQGKYFSEYREDFEYTLAQYLIEENIFPVSLRTGWNFMDNDWQNFLDKWLPYSMHNQYPAVRVDTTEPIDNIYDWSRSSSECVPFHPSSTDYQVPGNLKGYELRSVNYGSVSKTFMNTIFSKANSGTDQVVCIWGHVWDDDFPALMQKVDTNARSAAAAYPAVQFKYCTAVEAMQLWRKTNDFIAPTLILSEEVSGENVKFVVETNEPIFQQQPFIAIKDVYENFYRLECAAAGTNKWKSVGSVQRPLLAKAGAAVTDTLGNLATKFISYLPDDIYIDNESTGYQELYGSWSAGSSASWGLTSRQAVLSSTDSAAVRWSFTPKQTGLYNIFIQSPKPASPCSAITVTAVSGGNTILSRTFISEFSYNDWLYIGTVNLNALTGNYVEMKVTGAGNTGKTITADVVKISGLVKQKDMFIPEKILDPGSISQFDTLRVSLKVFNRGIDSMSVTGINSALGLVTAGSALPLRISAMGSAEAQLIFIGNEKGTFTDTVRIFSTDPGHKMETVVLNVKVEDYFVIVDNEDTAGYKESGNWAFSNAHAFGATSRYAQASQTPKPYAFFKTSLRLNGSYDVWFIVPTTQNASTKALYTLKVEGVARDTITVNQNTNSGNWVKLFSRFISAGQSVQLNILETQEVPAATVLRADAVKFSIIGDMSGINDGELNALPETTGLIQNYPNPFNASTIIKYRVARAGHVDGRSRISIKVIDILGQEIQTLVDDDKGPGEYTITWDAGRRPSGVYFCMMRTGSAAFVKKIVLIR